MNDITIRRPVQWLSAEETNVGCVRPLNEDSILSRPEIGLWTVADGMGGHDAGSVASKMIIDSLNEVVDKKHLNDLVTCIEDKIIDVNQRILKYSEMMLEGRIVGSTVISLIIKGRVGVCLWAGDSRLYRYSKGSLQQLTCDHSHVSELLKQGAISLEEAENHPEGNVITRAVGTYEDLYIDIETFEVRVGDIFLLCSDGLYNSVEKEGIMRCLRENNIEVAVNQLIETSLSNNAADNVSVVVVKGIHRNRI